MPRDVAALRAENARLRDTVERQRMLLEDKDAKIAGLQAGNAELEERVAAGAADLLEQRQFVAAAVAG